MNRARWAAVRALKDKPGVKLVGFDSSPQLVEALKNGVVDSLVVQDPFQMGISRWWRRWRS